MIKIGHKSTSFQEAEQWDIFQHVQMTPEERQEAAADIRRRVYGTDSPDVREVREAE